MSVSRVISREFTAGDTWTSLLADLYYGDSNATPIVLGALETVLFRMIDASSGVVKVNNAAAVIVTRGDAGAGTPAQVRYDWSAEDVTPAGRYIGWFIRSLDGITEHFPVQDRDIPRFNIIFRSDS